MMIDRRDFMAGTALIAIAPPLELLPAHLPPGDSKLGNPIFMINGWSTPHAEGDNADTAREQIWITVDRSWRTAWR